MGLRRSTTKLSARCMRKRENLSAMIESISSICLIFMLMRTCAAPHDGTGKKVLCRVVCSWAVEGEGQAARRPPPCPVALAGGRVGERGAAHRVDRRLDRGVLNL